MARKLRSAGSQSSRQTGRSCPLLTILALLVVLVASCGEPEEGAGAERYRVDLSFDPSPPRVGEAHCIVRVSDSDGDPATGCAVEVEGNMNHAGMVPVFGDALELAPGEYVSPFEFTMGGDWFVIVRVASPDGAEFEEIIDVPAVAVEANGSR